MEQNRDGNSHYQTSDTALAAWLYSLGFQLIEVDRNQFPSIFLFENGSEVIEAAKQFQTGQSVGDVRKYLSNYKMLITRAKGSSRF